MNFDFSSLKYSFSEINKYSINTVSQKYSVNYRFDHFRFLDFLVFLREQFLKITRMKTFSLAESIDFTPGIPTLLLYDSP